MPRLKHIYLEGHCYFVTTATIDRTPFFREHALAKAAISGLDFYRRRSDFDLHGFVIMPDHAHLLLTPLTASISDIMRNWKSFVAREVRRLSGVEGPVWGDGFFDRIIRDGAHYLGTLDYIHNNPVKAGICASTIDYPFSSARWYDDDTVLGAGAPSYGIGIGKRVTLRS